MLPNVDFVDEHAKGKKVTQVCEETNIALRNMLKQFDSIQKGGKMPRNKTCEETNLLHFNEQGRKILRSL